MQKEIPKVVLDWIRNNSDKFCIPDGNGSEYIFYHNQYWIEEPIAQLSDPIICNCYTNYDIPINLTKELAENKKHTLKFLRLIKDDHF